MATTDLILTALALMEERFPLSARQACRWRSTARFMPDFREGSPSPGDAEDIAFLEARRTKRR